MTGVLELSDFRDWLCKKYGLKPPKLDINWTAPGNIGIQKDLPDGRRLHMDGYFVPGYAVLTVWFYASNPLFTLAHEFHHYRGLRDEIEADKAAARDLEEYRAARLAGQIMLEAG